MRAKFNEIFNIERLKRLSDFQRILEIIGCEFVEVSVTANRRQIPDAGNILFEYYAFGTYLWFSFTEGKYEIRTVSKNRGLSTWRRARATIMCLISLLQEI